MGTSGRGNCLIDKFVKSNAGYGVMFRIYNLNNIRDEKHNCTRDKRTSFPGRPGNKHSGLPFAVGGVHPSAAPISCSHRHIKSITF